MSSVSQKRKAENQADALEAAEARVAELERELPKYQLLNVMIAETPLTLDALLISCNVLTPVKIPNAVLDVNNYCRVQKSRDSVSVVDEISSAHSTPANGELRLNRFRLSDVSPDRCPKFASFTPDEIYLEVLVKAKFSRADFDFDGFLSDLVKKLDELRAIIYSVKWVDGMKESAWSESRLQMLLQLFLDYMLARWFGSENDGALLRASSATGNKIHLDFPGYDGENIQYAGCSDIKVQCDNADFPAAILEMKVAFGGGTSRLYHSEASSAKQQLLGQSMGLLQASGKSCVLSYLTDLMAISVLHLSAGDIHSAGIAHLSNRVTDGRLYCLLLLLMCFDISESEWTSLGADPDSCTEVVLEDEEAVSATDDKKANTPANIVPAKTRSGKIGGGAGSGLSCSLRPIGDEDEEAEDRRLTDIINMNRWQAKRTGVPFLCQKELQDNIRSASDRTAAFFT
mmetsp:Transcript_9450/g.20929  ORF Transcript_9450/g.20929 Transcript_9450/m.20929 type:complete len:458 (-) Transcript_9450:32-1405(-)